MLLKIDFAGLGEVRQHWRGIGVTLFVNWAVKPFSMALLGWVFIGWLFRPYLPADQIGSYIAGLILLAAAPCRSEEHTSDLQSLMRISYAVFCSNKKQKDTTITIQTKYNDNK